jgi:hypothetical protein
MARSYALGGGHALGAEFCVAGPAGGRAQSGQPGTGTLPGFAADAGRHVAADAGVFEREQFQAPAGEPAPETVQARGRA